MSVCVAYRYLETVEEVPRTSAWRRHCLNRGDLAQPTSAPEVSIEICINLLVSEEKFGLCVLLSDMITKYNY